MLKNPEKFNGQNFKRWQQKMFFYLTTLNLARFLKETAHQVEPPKEGQPSNAHAVQVVEAWKHSDFLCHNYVLNGLADDLYNVEGLEVLIHEIHAERMTVCETFQDAAINKKEISVEDLIVRLRIEVENNLAQKNTYAPDSAKANMVEHAGSSLKSNSREKGKGKKKNDNKGKGKAGYLTLKAGIVKQKFQRTCYNYDRPGHRAANCKMPKRVNPRQANMVNDNMDMIAMMSDVIAMISEVNLVGSNNSGWWVDTGATRHKELKLTNVLYALEICKNFVSGWLLNKFGFCLVFESDKLVLSRNQMYVGKGYAMNAIDKFVLYKTEVENQLGQKIKVVRSDRRGEYVYSFADRCVKHRVGHEFTAPYSPQQNENEPTSYREAVTSSKWNQWKEAIKSEIDYILQNHTWELVDLAPGCKPLGYKWIFKKKMKADGTIDKYKSRLVIKGYRQRDGLDYFDTYSPITRITSIRMVLAIAALRNLEVHQMDVNTAFLNGDLEEGIYMNQPDGFIAPGQESKDSRSTSEYVFTLGGAAISWKSSKQTVIAKSTLESEFIPLDKYGEEAEWLRVISIDFVKSKDNIADPLTKGLSRELVMADDEQDIKMWDDAEFLERVVQATEAAVSTQQQQQQLFRPPPPSSWKTTNMVLEGTVTDDATDAWLTLDQKAPPNGNQLTSHVVGLRCHIGIISNLVFCFLLSANPKNILIGSVNKELGKKGVWIVLMHMGAGKTWYGVPRDVVMAFEDVVRVHGYGGEANPIGEL
uniref:Peroxidase 9 n=1 Tax=Tanacetum cinerariifolium TaxID=118510 RepID=A0A6L2J519_TANCI|nr:peroxidase 9 [Tanacetum cinerariifolium]